MVPKMVAKVALVAAIFKLSSAASIICSLLNSAAYQRSENPPHTEAMADWLNENAINTSIGIYKNAKPKHSAENTKREDFCMVILAPAGCAETA